MVGDPTQRAEEAPARRVHRVGVTRLEHQCAVRLRALAGTLTRAVDVPPTVDIVQLRSPDTRAPVGTARLPHKRLACVAEVLERLGSPDLNAVSERKGEVESLATRDNPGVRRLNVGNRLVGHGSYKLRIPVPVFDLFLVACCSASTTVRLCPQGSFLACSRQGRSVRPYKLWCKAIL